MVSRRLESDIKLKGHRFTVSHNGGGQKVGEKIHEKVQETAGENLILLLLSIPLAMSTGTTTFVLVMKWFTLFLRQILHRIGNDILTLHIRKLRPSEVLLAKVA